jgi:hypothetical protein
MKRWHVIKGDGERFATNDKKYRDMRMDAYVWVNQSVLWTKEQALHLLEYGNVFNEDSI